MRVRLVGRLVLALALSSAVASAGVTIVTTAQASAVAHKSAVAQKKHPKKHKKKKHHKSSAASESKKLKALASGVSGEKHATFEVVYTTTSAGHSESVTFAQSPPKYLIKTATGGSVIYTGKETLYCSSSSSCISMSTGATNPMAPLEELFSPTTAKSFFSEAESEVAAKLAGYSVSFSSKSYAGLSSTCATVSGNGQSGTYCVAKNGLLTYAGSATGHIQLTSYTGNVPSAAFTPPGGATIITEPTT
jgi:hypothetical protein